MFIFLPQDEFVRQCFSKRHTVKILCRVRACPFRSPENGRHVLIRFNPHVAEMLGKVTVTAIAEKLRKDHTADLEKFIWTQLRPKVQRAIPIGCVLEDSATPKRLTLVPKDTADESFRQTLLSLVPSPQSPFKRKVPKTNTPPRLSTRLRKRTRRLRVAISARV